MLFIQKYELKPVKEFRSFFQVLCWLLDGEVNDHICLVHLDQHLLIIILAQHLKISIITIKKIIFKSEFHMRQYREDDHREDAPHFTYACGFCWRHNALEPDHYLFLHSHSLLKFAFSLL